MTRRSLLEDGDSVRFVDLDSSKSQQPGDVVATDDQALIREWAARHAAEPATGEATESGPATVGVRDEGAGIRFNFPAAGHFRSITWDEWFEHFRRHDLMFVYEHDERGRPPSHRYRLVPRQKLHAAHIPRE